MKRMIVGAIAGSAVVLVSLVLSGCLGTPPAGAGAGSGELAALPAYGLIVPAEAVRVLSALRDDPDFVLLDIRTPAEVTTGHISGATNLDFYDPQFVEQLHSLDRDKVYLIYCRTGNRTGQARTTMAGMGFDRVYELAGGIRDWTALAYPVCIGALTPNHACAGA